MSKITSLYRTKYTGREVISLKSKIRRLGILVIIGAFLMIPAYAVSARVPVVSPSVTFNGTKATCFVRITADRPSDKISATMELWQGSTLIDSWSGDSTWSLKLEETTSVSRNKTYDLVVNYSINGIDKTPVSISRTCA